MSEHCTTTRIHRQRSDRRTTRHNPHALSHSRRFTAPPRASVSRPEEARIPIAQTTRLTRVETTSGKESVERKRCVRVRFIAHAERQRKGRTSVPSNFHPRLEEESRLHCARHVGHRSASKPGENDRVDASVTPCDAVDTLKENSTRRYVGSRDDFRDARRVATGESSPGRIGARRSGGAPRRRDSSRGCRAGCRAVRERVRGCRGRFYFACVLRALRGLGGSARARGRAGGFHVDGALGGTTRAKS